MVSHTHRETKEEDYNESTTKGSSSHCSNGKSSFSTQLHLAAVHAPSHEEEVVEPLSSPMKTEDSMIECPYPGSHINMHGIRQRSSTSQQHKFRHLRGSRFSSSSSSSSVLRRMIVSVWMLMIVVGVVVVVVHAEDYYNNFDDASAGAADDGGAAEQNQYNNNYNGDDGNNGNGNYIDYNYYGDDRYNQNNYDDDVNYQKEQQQYQHKDDDSFHWNGNGRDQNSVGFEGVSFMPLSCINYNSGHMIKFQLFDAAAASHHQCRFATEISTFVVSISHFMRAYFNYQALKHGSAFVLPADAAMLNCVQMNNGVKLWVKIGCRERETFTSTQLQLRLYTDAQCAQPYEDGQTSRMHAKKGYKIGSSGYFSTKVSFKAPFYSCLSCTPSTISSTFNKKSGSWYDDDSANNNKNNNYNNNNNHNDDDNNNNNVGDDNGHQNDDTKDDRMAANDDVNYAYDDANNKNRLLLPLVVSQVDVRAYEREFWNEVNQQQLQVRQQQQPQDIERRSLYGNYYDVGSWNVCQRIYKYGMWCDKECRALDYFRTDQWSASDVFLLVIMCVFITAMMLLVFAKRLKAQQKSRLYGDDKSVSGQSSLPGLPPMAMAMIFLVILTIIITLAKIHFINETLLFAVAACILLFIYMLKLTLFESRRPVLLAAPRHDDLYVQNPLEDHLFD